MKLCKINFSWLNTDLKVSLSLSLSFFFIHSSHILNKKKYHELLNNKKKLLHTLSFGPLSLSFYLLDCCGVTRETPLWLCKMRF